MTTSNLKITIIFGLLLAGCGKSDSAGGQVPTSWETLVTQSVGAQGGTVQTNDGRVTLEIPAGALSSAREITISPVDGYPNESGAVVGGTVYEFGPDGLQFDQSVKLSLQFETGNIPTGKTDGLRLYKRDGERWMPVAGQVEAEGNMLSGHISSFSSYGLADIGLLDLLFDKVRLNSFYQQSEGEPYYLGNLEASGNYNGWQNIDFPEGGIPETAYESNPNCNTSTMQFQGGMDISDREYTWSPEAKAGSQQANAIVDVSSSLLGTADLFVYSRAVAEPESNWSEEGEEGGGAFSILGFKLSVDIHNPDEQSYIIAATWTDLKTLFSGSGEYEIGVGFSGDTCTESYGGYSSHDLLWYNWEDNGEVDIPVGTGRLFEIAGEQHGQFVLDVMLHTRSWSSRMYTPYDGAALAEGKFYLDLLPIVK